MSVYPVFIGNSTGTPIMTGYVASIREFVDPFAIEFVVRAGEIIGILI